MFVVWFPNNRRTLKQIGEQIFSWMFDITVFGLIKTRNESKFIIYFRSAAFSAAIQLYVVDMLGAIPSIRQYSIECHWSTNEFVCISSYNISIDCSRDQNRFAALACCCCWPRWYLIDACLQADELSNSFRLLVETWMSLNDIIRL